MEGSPVRWNDEFASQRYYIDKTETHELLAKRVGTFVANGDERHIEPFIRMIIEMKFIPAGRTLRNAGRPKGGLINCYALEIDDTIESIAETIGNCIILNAEGGGVGLNASLVRPKKSPIKGKGGDASGPVSWLKIIDVAAGEIETGGQRRAALLALLDIGHPDIERFIDAKVVDGTLPNFNISVGIRQNFLDAVKEDEMWPLSFRGQVHKEVKAKYLWDKILNNMLKYADPGILNLDNLYSNNSWAIGYPIATTNPCGEICLEHGGSCDLGSFVLPSFVKQGEFDWKDFEEHIKLAVRFLDNVLDVNKWTLQINRDQAQALRRIGIGTTGLADALFMLGVRYGSMECIEFLDKLYSFLRDKAYRASMELAQEKGVFPKCTAALVKSKFIRTLPRSVQRKIKENGLRNVTMLTCPPVGSTSILVGVTSGIEPLFAKAYERKDKRKKVEKYVHYLAETNCKEDWYVDSYDITPEEHFEIVATVQRYIDSGVSKTINVPASYKGEDLSNLLLDYLGDIKGVTIYRDGSKKNQVLTPCKNGTCDI